MMKVHIALTNSSRFTLYNVLHLGIMWQKYEGKYKKFIYFHDTEMGRLVYPVADIAQMMTVED